MDTKYIKDILNNPDLCSDIIINRYIQGKLLFNFELHYIPARYDKGLDTLSRKELTGKDIIEALKDDNTKKYYIIIKEEI